MSYDKFRYWAQHLFPGIIDVTIICFCFWALLWGLAQAWSSWSQHRVVDAPEWAAPPVAEEPEPRPTGRWIAKTGAVAFPPTGEFVVNAPKGSSDEGRVRATFRLDKWPVRVLITTPPPQSTTWEIQIEEGGRYSVAAAR